MDKTVDLKHLTRKQIKILDSLPIINNDETTNNEKWKQTAIRNAKSFLSGFDNAMSKYIAKVKWSRVEESKMMINCKQCGKRLRASAGQYCSKQCELKYRRDNKCQKCGWHEVNEFTGKVPLQVHHKDGDFTNNKLDNLELLCPNCYSLTDNFGRRNKTGKERHYRIVMKKKKITKGRRHRVVKKKE